MSFQLCGRRITISFFFTALVAFVLFCDARGTAVSGLMAAGCHEAGHLLMMASLGVPVLEFRFTPFGVEMIRGEGGRIGYFSDALVSFSGPLANILVFLVCLLFGQEGSTFAQGNLLLAGMNLLPAESLDGGQLLFSLLCPAMGVERAARTAQLISFFVLIPLAVLSFLLLFRSRYNISLLLVMLYLIGLLCKQGRFF